jgi:hypothetical protein
MSDDLIDGYRLPAVPVSAPPGSPQKIEALTARAAEHVCLWHHRDGVLPESHGVRIRRCARGNVITFGGLVQLQGVLAGPVEADEDDDDELEGPP